MSQVITKVEFNSTKFWFLEQCTKDAHSNECSTLLRSSAVLINV